MHKLLQKVENVPQGVRTGRKAMPFAQVVRRSFSPRIQIFEVQARVEPASVNIN